ncbi:MAG TPA: hypothetical protein EYQ50_24520, partial [Verrucomicrobiales bacterium]|nr:hypothetical protein [Verrucomicrobiales bacterium]
QTHLWAVKLRVIVKSPVRGNRTPGSVRGASGNRRPYLDLVVSLTQHLGTPILSQCSKSKFLLVRNRENAFKSKRVWIYRSRDSRIWT